MTLDCGAACGQEPIFQYRLPRMTNRAGMLLWDYGAD